MYSGTTRWRFGSICKQDWRGFAVDLFEYLPKQAVDGTAFSAVGFRLALDGYSNFVGSVRIAGKLLGETLQPEAMFLAELEARDWLATLSATYNLADGLNLKAGAAFYGSFRADGDLEREWGTFSNSRTIDKDYLFLELRLNF